MRRPIFLKAIDKCFRYLIILAFIYCPFNHYGQSLFSPDSVLYRMKNDMAIFTADSLQGRFSGTAYEIKARDYIVSKFKEAGLKPVVGDTSYNQPFYVKTIGTTCYNVCGLIDNGASHTVVIGAHYDHVGMGQYGSRYKKGYIHYGADDNASGVVGILEIARYLAGLENLKYNYLFVAFSAEELGLHGSSYFVQSRLMKDYKIRYMINFDMIGRFNFDNKKRLVVFGSASSNAWKKVLKKPEDKSFKIKKVPFGPPFSDHSAFYKKNIPILYFTTGIHPEYHTPFDTYDLINFEGMGYIISYLKKLILDVEKLQQIEFRQSNNFQKIRSYAFSATMMN